MSARIKPLRTAVIFSAVFGVAVGGAHCGQEADRNASTSATIGPAGGTLSLGAVTLEIPPGALVREETLGIRELAGSDGSVSGFETLTPLYGFEPSGLRFQKPIKATFRASSMTEIGEIAWSNSDDSALAEVDTTRDGLALAAQVDHFSRGCAVVSRRCGAVGQPCCRASSCKGGLSCDAAAGRCAGTVTPGDGGVSDASLDAKPDAPPGDGGAPTVSCVRILAGPDRTEATSVATDPAGNMIVAGFFKGSADFGGGALVSAGAEDVFVAKYDSACNHVWSRRFGDAASQALVGFSPLAVVAGGEIVLFGGDKGATDFGFGPLSAGVGSFVVRLRSDGTPLWSRKWVSDAVGVIPTSYAVTSTGEVLAGGYFTGTADFGGGPLTAAPGPGEDMFLVKLDAAGNHIWSKSFPGTNPTNKNTGTVGARSHRLESIAVESSGNILISAEVTGLVDLGGGPIGVPQPQGNNGAVLLARFDPTGGLVRAAAYGADGVAGPSWVQTSPGGDIVLAANFTTPVDFGSGVVASPGEVIVRLTSTWTGIWSKSFPTMTTSTGISPVGLSTSPSSTDFLYFGYLYGPISFGGPTFTSDKSDAGVYVDGFVARFNASGSHVQSLAFGGAKNQTVSAAVAHGASTVLVGDFQGTTRIAGVDYTAVDAQQDSFLIKLTP